MIAASLMTQLSISVILGGVLGLGLTLLLWATPAWRAPGLTRRLAPYLRDISDPRGLTPIVAAQRLSIRVLLERGGRVFGGLDALTVRLERAGRAIDATTFRARQLAWGISALLLGALLAISVSIAGRGTPTIVLIPVVFAGAAIVGYDVALTRAVAARAARASEELPTILEFLSLCLSAGEGAYDAIRRVGDLGTGELAGELHRAVLAVKTGSSLSDALADVGRRLNTVAVTRAVGQIVAAIDSGAPLARVLQAQANDAREDAKRLLIERAGRKEIYMLIPVKVEY